MKTRYCFGGDEHIFVEVDEEMSLDAFFKTLSITNAVRDSRIKGVTEICPANASFQIKFDPDEISPEDMLTELKSLEAGAEHAEAVLETRIIEVPVLYNDPWTRETLMRFRERHQDPNSTDIEFAARINNFDSVEAFIAAHSGAPWFVSMVGFVAGLPFMFQMADRARQIEVPIYLRPRTDTPKLTVGYFMLGTVISADMDLIGQMQPNMPTKFVAFDMATALAARHDRAALMDEVRAGLL